MANVIMPLPWWRLPFATALAMHGVVVKRCQLCRTNLCQICDINNMPMHCNTHWFNRLQFICQACHECIDWQRATFNIDMSSNLAMIRGIASTGYSFPFDEAMRDFKNTQHLNSLPLLIHVLRQLHPPSHCYPHNSLIIPVPTTTARIKERGFSPLWWLALYLSFHWQIPIFTGMARVDRAHQQGLSRQERLDNIKQAFYLHDIPQAKHLIVFDDVVTTGATMGEVIQLISNTKTHYIIHAFAALHGNA